MASIKAKALYSFQSENPEEISILEHEQLLVFNETSLDGWLEGQNSRGHRGLFPASYVEILKTSASSSLSSYTDCSPAGSPGSPGAFFAPGPDHQSSYDDDDYDDDWDDWDDSSTVVDEPPATGGTNGHNHRVHQYPPPTGPPSPHSGVSHRHRPSVERQDSAAGSRLTAKGSVVGKNFNRFSSFVRSGGEAFILGEVPTVFKSTETYGVQMGPNGPQWSNSPHPFTCTIEDPTRQTKFKGIKSYISYKLTPSHTDRTVFRRYKHFDWLHNRLLHKFSVISVPHLPEKQATGRFEDDFIEKRKRRLILWMDHMTSHPVLSQYEGFQHFLTCTDERAWKQGKRRTEKDELVSANFFLTIRIPQEHQDLQDVEDRVDLFKAFSKRLDDSVLQLSNVAADLCRKHLGGFRKEFQKLGIAFNSISQAFEMDQPHLSVPLNKAISNTGRTYEAIGEMFADQPKNDLFRMLDTLSLYQGLLSNYPDIIHVQKGAIAKVKDSQRMSDEGKMDQEQADGISKRCRVVGFALQAEMNHFHERRIVDFKHMMQSYLQQQILFYQRIGQQLERTLSMYDNL
ncbi:sorting nexin-33 [Callorhinchus milii]|nr:sorting nexin-33 [Callorhinchus milii]|eukprot:gi/632938922/ref/XP_007906914.1/ PREDICTED: sorting nexin-33 [Callorhinchus milii]